MGCHPFFGVLHGMLYFLKIAHMTSTHWPHERFELLSFLAHPNHA